MYLITSSNSWAESNTNTLRFEWHVLANGFVQSFFCWAFCQFEFLHVWGIHYLEGSLFTASVFYVGFPNLRYKICVRARSKISSMVKSSMASFEGKYSSFVIYWAYSFSQIFFADWEALFPLLTKFLERNILDLCFLHPFDMMLPLSFPQCYLELIWLFWSFYEQLRLY